MTAPDHAWTAILLQDEDEDGKPIARGGEWPYGVVRVVRGHRGFQQFNVPAFKTLAKAEEMAAAQNKMDGVTEKDAALLVLASM